jgi:hypothetical protein
MYQKLGQGKVFICSTCNLQVDSKSKMLDRKIDKIKLKDATRNEVILQDKINEISDLLKVLSG